MAKSKIVTSVTQGEKPKTSGMSREAYRTVKAMDRAQLEAYIGRVYRDGFEAGRRSMEAKPVDNAATHTEESPDVQEIAGEPDAPAEG